MCQKVDIKDFKSVFFDMKGEGTKKKESPCSWEGQFT